jgi:hypothetical protein
VPIRSIISGPPKQREGLNVRGVWKHVDHACSFQRKAVLVHQHAKIARQASRMAGNIQHPLRRELRQRREHLTRAGARRVEQHVRVA